MKLINFPKMAIKKPGADPEISKGGGGGLHTKIIFDSSLSANTSMAKLTSLETPSLDKHYSLESEDVFRPGCRSVSHQQQFFSELPSPGGSHFTNY